jgi:hypothetical protein
LSKEENGMKKVDEAKADRQRLRDFFDSIHFDKPVEWRSVDTEPKDDGDEPPPKIKAKPKQATKPYTAL